MAKLVFFKILGGDFNSGFSVNMQIFNEEDRHLIADIEGKLPDAKDLPDCYAKWQSCYRQIVSDHNARLSVQNPSVTSTEIIAEIKKAKENLHFDINKWLNPEGKFIPIWTEILTNLKDENEDIRVIFKTDNSLLRRLPLFVWDIFFEERYHRSEMGVYLPVKLIGQKNTREKVQVLAVLGKEKYSSNITQIQIDKDWELLKNLLSSESNAEVIALPSPSLEELADALDEVRPQILFFAGHSHTEDEENIGRIVLSETESITIDDLKFELIKAAKTGLQLAIFNSCDGIGIAQQLYKLQIPNIIVMREPLPDKVAHRFLQRFLEAFAAGKPLNHAVRRAREKLNQLDRDFPGVMWLPMIWQNPAQPPLTWESLGGIVTGKALKQSNRESNRNQDTISWLQTQVYKDEYKTQYKTIIVDSSEINQSIANSLYCQNCDSPYKKDNIFCSQCGFKFNSKSTSPPVVCPNCNHKNLSTAVQCEACYTSLPIFIPPPVISTQFDRPEPTLFQLPPTIISSQVDRHDPSLAPIPQESSLSLNKITCSNCGYCENPLEATCCEACYSILQKVNCSECGYNGNTTDSEFCHACGSTLIVNNSKHASPSPPATNSLLLAGRYQITKALGAGGFSRTFLAQDTQLPGNPECVVKQMLIVGKDPDPKELFLYKRLFNNEAEILYKLGEYDRIPQLLAHFEQNNELYLVQEFVDGHELTEEISQRKIGENGILNILTEVLEILEFVHSNNIIHRDIKPSNLIRRRKDKKIVLIDFGASKEIQLSTHFQNNSLTVVSSPTVMIGTPGYVPLEQMRGHPRLNSDIYSLGMIAVYALTGREPSQFNHGYGVEVDWHNGANISNGLGKVIDKMIEENYKKRYQSATEVLKDLDSLRK